MSDTERINALVEALLSMQKRYLDSETKVEMLQEQLVHSNKRIDELEAQLQTEKKNREDENWRNRMVIEGYEKTLKKRREALEKAEVEYNEINKVCMEWEEKYYALQEQRSHDKYKMQDEIDYLQELVNEYKKAAEFKDRDVRNCEKELSEIKDLNASHERQIETLERTIEALQKELHYQVRGEDNWLDS